ncbi:MAG: amino acid permease [Chlamydiia bacterium]|nr:amino acid permease [Chlamydiia bacterium]
MNIVKSKRSIRIFTLTMINIAATCSIQNWPLTAEYGFSSLFFSLLSALIFFIPVSLVSAELATGWPERGGVFTWVKEAMGHRMGFLAVWLQWAENVIWYPTILSFIGAAIAYSFNPALANNNVYMGIVIIAAFWGATLMNLCGMKISGLISSVGVIVGTIIPGALIICLGLIWLFGSQPLQIELSWDALLPDLSSPYQLSLLVGVLTGFTGMEMSAVHARDVINPQKNYPRAIFLSALIVLFLFVLGTLSIAFVIPQKEISLVGGALEALSHFMRRYGLGSSVPILAILVAFGALGSMSTWAAGPIKGLLAAAQSGEFPPILHRVNKNDMPVAMMIMQGVIVSLLSLVFVLMRDVNISFWILLVLMSQLYLIMYVLMFVAAIILRYKRANVQRAYTIPGGRLGMWFVAGVGALGSLAALIISFFPPRQINTGNVLFYELFLLIGIVTVCTIPFVILLFKKPSWDKP